MTILKVEGLCKAYPEFALRDVSFSMESGSVMGFIGRNGAGKTTTLKSLLHLVHPDAGRITLLGKDMDCDKSTCSSKQSFNLSYLYILPFRRAIQRFPSLSISITVNDNI